MSCLVDIRVVEFISLSPIINDLHDKDIRMLDFYEIEIILQIFSLLNFGLLDSAPPLLCHCRGLKICLTSTTSY